MLQPPEYYDNLHRTSLRSFEHYTKSKYYEVWKRIAFELAREGTTKILDIGCGTGQLMMMLRDLGFEVRGFDHSQVAVAMCQARGLNVWVEDAVFYNYLTGWANGFVSTEVFEHLEGDEDFQLLDSMCDKELIFISLPTFMDESHVRCFPKKKDISKRYKHHLDIETIWKYPRRHLVKARVR